MCMMCDNQKYLALHIEKIENGYLIHINGKKHHIEYMWDLPILVLDYLE